MGRLVYLPIGKSPYIFSLSFYSMQWCLFTCHLPFCFVSYVVLFNFKSYTKNFRMRISSFFKAYTPYPQSVLHNLFSFKFWANLTSKNIGGKPHCSGPCVQSSFRIHQSKLHKKLINFLLSCLISVTRYSTDVARYL